MHACMHVSRHSLACRALVLPPQCSSACGAYLTPAVCSCLCRGSHGTAPSCPRARARAPCPWALAAGLTLSMHAACLPDAAWVHASRDVHRRVAEARAKLEQEDRDACHRLERRLERLITVALACVSCVGSISGYHRLYFGILSSGGHRQQTSALVLQPRAPE